MPLRPPVLDDRSFDDLVQEVLARIPAHTPEWTDARVGDPGRTIIELFAWLTDTLLYRVNLVPERQRLTFLRLLGIPLQPAVAARGLVTLSAEPKESTAAIAIRAGASIPRPAPFETLSEVTILPVVAEAYYKRPLTAEEQSQFESVVPGLAQIYGIQGRARPYVTTPVFVGGAVEAGGFDVVGQTIDNCLWLALLAQKDDADAAFIDQLRATLGNRQLLTVGVAPQVDVPALSEEIGPRAAIPYVWEISYVKDAARNLVDYITLDVTPGTDTTAGLTRQGTVRLALPGQGFISAPSNDVRQALTAGVNNRPPRLDDPQKQARLVAWLRLRPTQPLQSLSLSWVGINAVEIDQRQSVTGRIIGQSDGTANQEMQLPGRSVEPATLQIQVAEPQSGYQPWVQIEDLALAGRDDPVYTLDGEAGTIRFGDGVRGRVPPREARVRVALMRAGGGQAGNLPPGALTEINARLLDGSPPPGKIKVLQSLPTAGGDDSETLAQAETRIPAIFRHRDRAVTADDYRRLAADTPGVRPGRVEVLPRFKPQQRLSDVPGIVSVMALPGQDVIAPPNPRADRPFLETIFSYLDARRPLSTELYVIGCEYVAVGLGIGITVAPGFGRETVTQAVRDRLRAFLWPLIPGGTTGAGWELGRNVRDRELEVVVARVPGVLSVAGVRLFNTADGQAPADAGGWQRVDPAAAGGAAEIPMQSWQLPELLAVVVDADGNLPDNPGSAGGPAGPGDIGVPVVPEVC